MCLSRADTGWLARGCRGGEGLSALAASAVWLWLCLGSCPSWWHANIFRRATFCPKSRAQRVPAELFAVPSVMCRNDLEPANHLFLSPLEL